MDLVIPAFAPQTVSLTRKEEGLNMSSTQRPTCWEEYFTARVQSAHQSDHLKHSTMGEDHSVCLLLRL